MRGRSWLAEGRCLSGAPSIGLDCLDRYCLLSHAVERRANAIDQHLRQCNLVQDMQAEPQVSFEIAMGE